MAEQNSTTEDDYQRAARHRFTMLSDPYRSMAFAAHDLVAWLENAGHPEQAQNARDLLDWIVDHG